jgi:hypothetical protein
MENCSGCEKRKRETAEKLRNRGHHRLAAAVESIPTPKLTLRLGKRRERRTEVRGGPHLLEASKTTAEGAGDDGS